METPKKAGTLIPIFNARTGKAEEVPPVIKSDAEWKAQLTPEQFQVARKKSAIHKSGSVRWRICWWRSKKQSGKLKRLPGLV